MSIEKVILAIVLSNIYSCLNNAQLKHEVLNLRQLDSLEISKMILEREQAMINKDIQIVMFQFSDSATWINSQGYYFEGKNNVSKFHNMLTGNDSLDYFYEAGRPKIKLIDNHNALAYYSWKMFWYKKTNPSDTTFKEIGLMTLNAHKIDNKWKWIAVTNQHTPWFYEKIIPITVD